MNNPYQNQGGNDMHGGIRGGLFNNQNPYTGINGSRFQGNQGLNRFGGMNGINGLNGMNGMNSQPNYANNFGRNSAYAGNSNFGQNLNQDPFRTQSPSKPQTFSENENGMNSYGLANQQNRPGGFNLKGANPGFQNLQDVSGRRGSHSPQGLNYPNFANQGQSPRNDGNYFGSRSRGRFSYPGHDRTSQSPIKPQDNQNGIFGNQNQNQNQYPNSFLRNNNNIGGSSSPGNYQASPRFGNQQRSDNSPGLSKGQENLGNQ
jgi:hypothetical protein